MPDDEQAADEREDEPDEPTPDEVTDGPAISPYGIASAALGALSVAAIVLGWFIWSAHRSDLDERRLSDPGHAGRRRLDRRADQHEHRQRPGSLQRLHDGTVGELNADFDSAIQPYQQVVQRLQSRSRGEVEAVAFETVHHDLDAQPGRPAQAEQLPASIARRTDTVMVVATSVSENSGGNPQTVHWNLRLGISDVDGKLMISRLESIR